MNYYPQDQQQEEQQRELIASKHLEEVNE